MATKVINENTSLDVTITFTDENGDPFTPEELYYNLVDDKSETIIISNSLITPTGSTETITIERSANAILDTANAVEARTLTVDARYSSGSKGVTTEYKFNVKNLANL